MLTASIVLRRLAGFIGGLVLTSPIQLFSGSDSGALHAQEANYDESQIPPYVLPDPLVTLSGQPVATMEAWPERRAEIVRMFAEQMFGKTPTASLPVQYRELSRKDDALNGLATRREIELTFSGNGKQLRLTCLLYIPNHAVRPVPAFVGLNFGGNHTVTSEPDVLVPPTWVRNNPELGISDNRASEQSRGKDAQAWSVEKVMGRGYALATMYYGDIDPDFDDNFQNGIHGLFAANSQQIAPDTWGSIGAWSWGLSRIVDYLVTEVPAINPAQIAVMGHSRLGKTALWAGALDTRFAVVVSNNSGCGGAALSRRKFGETVARINRSFPHWFCDNFNQYNNNEDALPIDQHMLIALMAPRPVLICSAQDDRWADPRGEFLSAYHATPVFELLGGSGIRSDELPELNVLLKHTVGYRIRPGQHAVLPEDWDAYLDFADHHWK